MEVGCPDSWHHDSGRSWKKKRRRKKKKKKEEEEEKEDAVRMASKLLSCISTLEDRQPPGTRQFTKQTNYNLNL